VNPSPPTIRHATKDDVDDLLALWKRSGASPSVTETPRDLRRVVDAPHAAVEGDREIAQVFWESVGFEHYDGMRRNSKNL
jgi:hypothetical protein